MDLEALLAQVPALKEQAKKERQAGNEALVRAQLFERMVRDIEALVRGGDGTTPMLFDEQYDPSDDGLDVHLTGIAAVREVMQENLGRPMRSRDIQKILDSRGWISPTNQAPIRSTEVALHRMARRKEIDRLDRGVFVMRPKLPEAPDEG